MKTLPPDDKDWSWVLDRSCPECKFEAGVMPLLGASGVMTEAVDELKRALTKPNARTRPTPMTWSPVEYACHVHDACNVFGKRIGLVLDRENPMLPNWDPDATASEKRYDQQRPEVVAAGLQRSLEALLLLLDDIPDNAWDRSALRSDGLRFTLSSLVRYLAHDAVHHAHDVRSGDRRELKRD